MIKISEKRMEVAFNFFDKHCGKTLTKELFLELCKNLEIDSEKINEAENIENGMELPEWFTKSLWLREIIKI